MLPYLSRKSKWIWPEPLEPQGKANTSFPNFFLLKFDQSDKNVNWCRPLSLIDNCSSIPQTLPRANPRSPQRPPTLNYSPTFFIWTFLFPEQRPPQSFGNCDPNWLFCTRRPRLPSLLSGHSQWHSGSMVLLETLLASSFMGKKSNPPKDRISGDILKQKRKWASLTASLSFHVLKPTLQFLSFFM